MIAPAKAVLSVLSCSALLACLELIIRAALIVSDPGARVARVMDGGGIPVTVGQVLDVFGGLVVLIPESTLGALTVEARSEFTRAAERSTGAVVFLVPDFAFTADF